MKEGLNQGEAVKYVARLSLYRYSLNFLVGAILLIGSLSALSQALIVPSNGHAAGAIVIASVGVVLLALAVFLWPFLARKRTELAITNKRLIAKFGLFSAQSIEIRLDKIESVQVKQGLLGRILNYGDIVVTGTGSTFEPVRNIADPLAFRAALNQAMDPADALRAADMSTLRTAAIQRS